MSPLSRKAPLDKAVEKASPDTGCRIIYSSSGSRSQSLRLSAEDSSEGWKGGSLWRSHESDPGRKSAIIFLEPPSGERTSVGGLLERMKRRGDADGR